MSVLLHQILVYWRSILVVALPILLSPLLFLSEGQEAKAGYVIIIVALYWMTEALPLAATSLLPILLLPLLGIMDTGKVCKAYINETSVMFLGSLIVALSVEFCNLHKRIALRVLLIVGASREWLILGFMLTSMFLSMWISNTASTAMMVPIANAIIKELYKDNGGKRDSEKGSNNCLPTVSSTLTLVSSDSSIATIDSKPELESDDVTQSELESQLSENDNDAAKMRKCILLSVAYASNVGGTATLIGTAPNLVLKGVLSDLYSKAPELNFATWMAFNIPVVLVNVFLAWIWLQFLFFGFSKKKTGEVSRVKSVLRKQYDDLGGITFHETAIAVLFASCVGLWFFRDPQFIPGWASVFRPTKLGDATAVVGILFLMFTIPAKPDFWCFKRSDERSVQPSPALLDWDFVQAKLPWGIILLLGGGFAISEASKVSGLSLWIGLQLSALQVLPPFAIMVIICIMAAAITEVASNTATTNILLPILAEMANVMRINPLYLMIPATISCSYAFILPVATPPNAIVFSASKMKSSDMIKAGLLMNIICIVVLCAFMGCLGTYLFDAGGYPDWAGPPVALAVSLNQTANLTVPLLAV